MNEAVANFMLRDTKTNVLRTWLNISWPTAHDMKLVNEFVYWLVPHLHLPDHYSAVMSQNREKEFTWIAGLVYFDYKVWLNVR